MLGDEVPNKDKWIGVSYCRVSTDGQFRNTDGSTRDDASPEAQRQRCVDHAKFLGSKHRKEYAFHAHLSDNGFSGKDTNRPAYKRLWSLVAERKINFVIATELSRLSRSVPDFLALVDHCEKSQVKLYVISQDFDPTSISGRAMMAILVVLAQFERETTAHRVRENARIRLVNDGKINGSSEVLGLIRDPRRRGHFIADPEGLASVEKILRIYLRFPSRSKTLVAAKDAGITGPRGTELTTRMVDSILENVKWRYRGLWRANFENRDKDPTSLSQSNRFQFVNLPHGRLIDEGLLDEVQRKIDDTHTKKKRSGTGNYVYLLSHILHFEDGTRFSGQGPKGGMYRYYWNEKSGHRIHCDDLDKIVIQRIKSYFKSSEAFAALVKEAIRVRETNLPKVEAGIRDANQRLRDLDDQEGGLRKQLLNGILGNQPEFISWLQEQVVQLTHQKRALQANLEAMERNRSEIRSKTGLEQLEPKVREFSGRFDRLSRVEQRNLIEQIIQQVTVRTDNKIELSLNWAPPGVTEDTFLDCELNGRGGGI